MSSLAYISPGVFDNALNVMVLSLLSLVCNGVCIEILVLLKQQRYSYSHGFLVESAQKETLLKGKNLIHFQTSLIVLFLFK